eukprot:5377037-Heterocapsa_arctica.AAC.1
MTVSSEVPFLVVAAGSPPSSGLDGASVMDVRETDSASDGRKQPSNMIRMMQGRMRSSLPLRFRKKL